MPWQKRLRQEPVQEVANSICGDNYCIFNAIYKQLSSFKVSKERRRKIETYWRQKKAKRKWCQICMMK